MPYQLEKGPYFSVTETVLEDFDQRIDVLVDLRLQRDADAMPTLESDSLDTSRGNIQTEDQRRYHQNRHWYGKTQLASGYWGPQAPFDPVTNPRTGFWHNWYGDAEGIVRETYTRAIEVSLGIPHDTTVTDKSAIVELARRPEHGRFWPIEIFTRCPAPWFEGWVTWQSEGPSNGHVTVHIHTPSHDRSNLLTSPVRPGYTTPEYQDEINFPPPLPSDGKRGMWVVAHLYQELVNPPFAGPVVSGPSEALDGHPDQKAPWKLPRFGAVYHSQGDIVTVRPSEPNGGVLADGRPYIP